MTTPPLSFVDWNGATQVATSCQSVKVRRCTQLAAVPVELRTQTSGDVDEWWASSLAVWGSGVRVPSAPLLLTWADGSGARAGGCPHTFRVMRRESFCCGHGPPGLASATVVAIRGGIPNGSTDVRKRSRGSPVGFRRRPAVGPCVGRSRRRAQRRAAALDRATRPTTEQAPAAGTEGWIALPGGELEDLANDEYS